MAAKSIYFDTSFFVDFYQSMEDGLATFDELEKSRKHLVSTTQTHNEFFRNRNSVLQVLIKQFEDSVKFNPYATSILKEIPQHAELLKLRDQMKEKALSVANQLREILSDPSKDPVARRFNNLFDSKDFKHYVVEPTHVQKAQMRKVLGQPPTSPDKYTVGDEVNWVTLLSNVTTDLIIVSRDKTFHNNSHLLKTEFHAATGKDLVLVTKKASEALKAIGEQPTSQLIDEEIEVERTFKRARRQQKLKIPMLSESYYGDARYIPPSESSGPCPRCGTDGPWESVKCRGCGFMDD